MQSTISALRALQELDIDIFRLRAELKRLPEEREQRRAAIDAVRRKCEEVHRRGLELKVRVKEIEDETSMQRQRLRKLEHEAANSRSDMALLAAYQHEMRELKRSIGRAEEEGLSYLEQIEGTEAEEKALKAEIAAAEQVFEEFGKNVAAEIQAAERRLAELVRERQTRQTTEVDRESLQLYDRLITAREGVALAELDGRVCQACYMEVPTNLYVRVARSASLTQCPSCDRILFLRS
jgi:predicted  nucleic acid-binding Zn-ribbon protein